MLFATLDQYNSLFEQFSGQELTKRNLLLSTNGNQDNENRLTDRVI